MGTQPRRSRAFSTDLLKRSRKIHLFTTKCSKKKAPEFKWSLGKECMEIRHWHSHRDRHNGILQQDWYGAGRGARMQRRHPLSASGQIQAHLTPAPRAEGQDQPGRAGGCWRRAATVGRGHDPQGSRDQAGVAAAHGDRPHAQPMPGTVPHCPKQLRVPAAQQDVENIKEGNKIKQKEASPPTHLPPSHPQNSPRKHLTPGTVRLETSSGQGALPAPYLSL